MPPRSGCSACHLLIACVISLLTVTFSTVAFFGPNSPALQYLSQVTISPSTQLQPQNRGPATTPDGPSLSFGIFGSCAQSRNDGARTCTGMAFNPQYNFSVLPRNTPTYVLVDPPIHNKIFGYIAFGLWPLLFFLVLLILYNRFSGTMQWVETFLMRTLLFPWIGVIACVISCVNFWSLHLYFDSICYNFNHFVARQGAAGPLLMASRGDALRYGYASCALFCIPWLTILVESMYLADKSGDQGDNSADQLTDSPSSTLSPSSTSSTLSPSSTFSPSMFSPSMFTPAPPYKDGFSLPGYYPASPRNIPVPPTPSSQNGTYTPLRDRPWPQVSPNPGNALNLFAHHPAGFASPGPVPANGELPSLIDFGQTLTLPPAVVTTPPTPQTSTQGTPLQGTPLHNFPVMAPTPLLKDRLAVPQPSGSPARISPQLSSPSIYNTPLANTPIPLPNPALIGTPRSDSSSIYHTSDRNQPTSSSPLL